MAHGAKSGEPAWRKSCESGACIEIAAQGDTVMVRSSVAPDVILSLMRTEWHEFLAGAKEGLFDDV